MAILSIRRQLVIFAGGSGLGPALGAHRLGSGVGSLRLHVGLVWRP